MRYLQPEGRFLEEQYCQSKITCPKWKITCPKWKIHPCLNYNIITWMPHLAGLCHQAMFQALGAADSGWVQNAGTFLQHSVLEQKLKGHLFSFSGERLITAQLGATWNKQEQLDVDKFIYLLANSTNENVPIKGVVHLKKATCFVFQPECVLFISTDSKEFKCQRI